MYTFTKERDKNNKFDTTEIKHISDSVTTDKLVESFYYFMLGCGYHSESIISGFYTAIEQFEEKKLEE